jgi:hypothetical protein
MLKVRSPVAREKVVKSELLLDAKRARSLLALNQWVSRSPILLNLRRDPSSSLTKRPIAANLKDAMID